MRPNEQLSERIDCFKKRKKLPERSGDYWSADDLNTLKESYWDGVSISEIALQMGRNEVATYQQLAKMGLLSRQCKPRNREKKKSRAECLCPVCSVTHCQNCGKECPDAGRD